MPVTLCYLLLPLVPLCFSCYSCYPLFPLLPLVTLVTPLSPFVIPCSPLLPLVTLVTPCYSLFPLVIQARIYTGFHHFTEIGQILHIINIFLILKKNFKMKSGKWFGQSVNILSELLRNPGKGTLGSQNSKKFPKGNRSVFILDPLLLFLVPP